MSSSGRAVEFMRAWGDGHAQPHDPGCQRWGADPCDRCTFEAFPDPWDALMEAARIAGLSEPSGPEPATSDEPARCQHGKTDPHPVYYRTNTGAHDWAGECPGSAASGTPDGDR